MRKHEVVLIAGDGIGPEIAVSCKCVVEASGAPIRWVEAQAGAACIADHGKALPDETVEMIKHYRIALKGPITTPVATGFSSVNVELRRALDLYASVRPAHSLRGVNCRAPELNTVIIRENTEGLYAGREKMTGPDRAEATRVITKTACQRIVRFAFDYANRHCRKKVTAVHKGNILKLTDGLFLECFARERTALPHIDADDMIVDNACMQMAIAPERFDVVVTTNLFGDILSDLAAGLTGGPGLAAGANFGDDVALFEPVHGSAPDIADMNRANPVAMILSAAMMLEHIGLTDRAAAIRKSVMDVLSSCREKTPDLGGTATTDDITAAICSLLH